jgi:hypothetical protein
MAPQPNVCAGQMLTELLRATPGHGPTLPRGAHASRSFLNGATVHQEAWPSGSALMAKEAMRRAHASSLDHT